MQIEATFLLRIRTVQRRTTNVDKIKINLVVLISSLNNNYFEDAYRYTLKHMGDHDEKNSLCGGFLMYYKFSELTLEQ